MNNKIRTAIAAIIVFALLIQGGCGGKANAAQESLETVLTSLQNQDVQEAEIYLSAVGFDSELYSVSHEAFAAVYFSDFAFQILDTNTNKDGTVSLDVMIATKNMAEVLRAMEDALDAAFDSGRFPDEVKSTDAWFIEIYESRSFETREKTFTIVMKKDDAGSWEIEDKAMFGSILLDGYDPRQIG